MNYMGNQAVCQAPPHDAVAEKSVVGALLLDPDNIPAISRLLAPRHFYNEHNKLAYRALLDLHAKGAVDDTLLLAELKTHSMNGFDWEVYLLEAGQAVAVPGHADRYADLVIDAARQRRFISTAEDALLKARQGRVDEAIVSLQADVGDIKSPTQVTFTGLSAAELHKSEYRIETLVDDILVVGQPMIIGGAQKTLKTTIAWDLAISLAMGLPFLNHFQTHRTARVGYMSGEGGLPVLQDVGRRVYANKQISMDDLSSLIVCDRLPQLDQASQLEALGEFLQSSELEFVFLDPIYLCMSGADAGNVLSMGERLNAVNTTCQENGVTPILIHHVKKNRADPTAAIELTDLSWSGFAEFCGQWLLISRRAPYAPNPRGLHELLITSGSRTGHGGRWGVNVEEGVTGTDAGRYWWTEVIDLDQIHEQKQQAAESARQAKQGDRAQADAQSVVDFLYKHPGGETKNVIRDAVGLSGARIGAAINWLIGNEMITPSEVHRESRKTPFNGYKILEGDPL